MKCVAIVIVGRLSLTDVVSLAPNVLQIAEGGDLEMRTFNLVQTMIQGANFNFSTIPPLLAMCCYTLFFLCVLKNYKKYEFIRTEKRF